MRDSEIKRAGARSIFDELADRETLWEMKAFLHRFLQNDRRPDRIRRGRPRRSILDYVKTHFTTIIDFEAMAAHIGVSYSYMRKLTRDSTGKSILEHQHGLRIEEAERCFQPGPLDLGDLAESLGYNNIQSFERFFKKYTGVSAHEVPQASGDRCRQALQFQRSGSNNK